MTLYLLAAAEPKGDPLLLAFILIFFGWVIVLFLLQLFDR
jgi:hypothetical protein